MWGESWAVVRRAVRARAIRRRRAMVSLVICMAGSPQEDEEHGRDTHATFS